MHLVQKREEQGLEAGDTDPMLDDLSDEEWQFDEDPPELVAAREKLDQYLAAKQGVRGTSAAPVVL